MEIAIEDRSVDTHVATTSFLALFRPSHGKSNYWFEDVYFVRPRTFDEVVCGANA